MGNPPLRVWPPTQNGDWPKREGVGAREYFEQAPRPTQYAEATATGQMGSDNPRRIRLGGLSEVFVGLLGCARFGAVDGVEAAVDFVCLGPGLCACSCHVFDFGVFWWGESDLDF